MSNDATSGQESSGTDRQPAHRNELAAAADEQMLKRARWEHLRLAACAGARHVNVTNYSYDVQAARSGEHTYTVSIGRDGLPTGCTCPADEYHPGPCKHAVACADDREVLNEAMHGDSDSVRQYTEADADANQAVATDGGAAVDDSETCEQCGREGVERYVCDECADAADDRRDDDVSGTEPADFGGGESSGVDEL